MAAQFMTLKEAQAYLGTSKVKMTQLVKSGALRVYEDPLDKRKKLVRREDVETLTAPKEKAVQEGS